MTSEIPTQAECDYLTCPCDQQCRRLLAGVLAEAVPHGE